MRQKRISRKALAEAIWRDDDGSYAAMLRRLEAWRAFYELSELCQEQIGPVIEAVDATIADNPKPTPPQVIELSKALKDVRRELKRFLKTKTGGA